MPGNAGRQKAIVRKLVAGIEPCIIASAAEAMSGRFDGQIRLLLLLLLLLLITISAGSCISRIRSRNGPIVMMMMMMLMLAMAMRSNHLLTFRRRHRGLFHGQA